MRRNRVAAIATGTVAALIIGGAATMEKWGGSGDQDAHGTPETPPAAAAQSNRPENINASTTPSAAGAIACTGIIIEMSPAVSGSSSESTLVRMSPILQPAPNKGPVGVHVEYTQVGSDGRILRDTTESYPSSGGFAPESVDVAFASQAGVVDMSVDVPGQGVALCPPSVAEVGAGEDSSAPIITVGPVPTSGPIILHS